MCENMVESELSNVVSLPAGVLLDSARAHSGKQRETDKETDRT